MSLFGDILSPFHPKRAWDNPGGFLVGKLFPGKNTADTRLSSIPVNRSSYGLPMPLIYGKTRVPITLLWYGAFKAIPHTQKQPGGKGIGGGGTSTSYTYQAAAVLGLCEGPISDVGSYWVDKEKHGSLSDLGLTLFTGAGGQAVWSFLTTNAPTQAIPYDHTAYLAGGAIDLGNTASLPNLSVEVKGFQTNATYNDDAVPIAVITDYLTDANHGVGWNYLAAGLTGAGNTYESYCIAMGFFSSPQEMQQRPAVEFLREMLQLSNSEAVWSQGALKIIPYADAAVTGNGRTYTPDLTPLYSFNDNDYCPTLGEEPVMLARTGSARTYNKLPFQFLDRTLDYNTNLVTATDDQDILLNGERPMATVTMNQVTDAAVARLVAQIILQRQLYIRNIFKFRVRADYSLLEPMDLVAINESSRGIVNQLVRITQIDDDESDNFTITAEEMLVGTAGAPRYDTQLAAGYSANYNNAPGSVTTPLIIAAPPQLVDVNGGYELWIAVAGATPAAWGGCDVYASMDNTTFAYVGTIYGPSRYGTLATSPTAGSDPDTVNFINLNLADPNLQLVSGTQADADNLRTLVYLDGEIISYEYATLIGAGQYSLSSGGGARYNRRGKYGSVAASHSSGTNWMRIDDSIFRMRYDPGQIGQTIYFKFCSFNIYGRAKESLGAVSSYSKVLNATNAGANLPSGATFVARGNCGIVGNKFFKNSGSAAWDSDVYSKEAFAGGCSATWTYRGDPGDDYMIGLNSDPLTDQSYTSLDAAIQVIGPSALGLIWESSANQSGGGFAIAAGDVFSVRYDNQWVRYYQNSTLLREAYQPDKVFFLDSSFFSAASAALNVDFSPLSSATPSPFRARGNCKVSDTNVIKQGGSSAWDSDCFSIVGYPVCHVSFKVNDSSGPTIGMVGLNTDPTTDQSYFSIDYAWYFNAGVLEIYEGGSPVGSFGTYTIATELAVTYDGSTVTYWKDRVSMRTVSVAGLTLFMDSSFYGPGGGINSLRFGPTTNLAVADTSQIGANAATVTGLGIYDLLNTSPGIPNGTYFRPPESELVIPGPNYDCTVIVTVTCRLGGSFPSPFPSPVYARCAFADDGSTYSYSTETQLVEDPLNYSPGIPPAIAIQFHFSHSRSNAGVNAKANLAIFNGSGVGVTMTYANVHVQAEYVLR